MTGNALAIDAADPNSLAIILPEPLATFARDIPRELLIQDEITLTTLVAPSEQQRRLKIQFWEEYEAATLQGRHMLLSAICFGVCTQEYLIEFVQLRRNIAWLISPKPSYKLRVAELIDKGLDTIEQIFSIVPTEKNQISVRTLQLAALKMLDLRKHGGYTQRAEIKTLNKNIEAKETVHPSILGEGSVEELEAQVRELEQKITSGKNQNGSLLNAGDIIITANPGTGS